MLASPASSSEDEGFIGPLPAAPSNSSSKDEGFIGPLPAAPSNSSSEDEGFIGPLPAAHSNSSSEDEGFIGPLPAAPSNLISEDEGFIGPLPAAHSNSSSEDEGFIGPLPAAPSKRAVMVGLRYLDDEKSSLDSPWYDAEGFQEALVIKCDYLKKDTILIEDRPEGPLVDSLFIINQLNKVERESNFGDIIFISFAGHSKPNIHGEMCFFIGVERSSLRGSHLKEILIRMATKCIVVVVLDTCNAEALLGDLPQMVNDSTGIILFTACREYEKSRSIIFPGSIFTCGVLTYHMLGLIFENESITYDELFTEAKVSVNKFCKTMVEKGHEKGQHIGMQFTNVGLIRRKFAR